MPTVKINDENLLKIIEKRYSSAATLQEKYHEEWKTRYRLYRQKDTQNRYKGIEVNLPITWGIVRTVQSKSGVRAIPSITIKSTSSVYDDTKKGEGKEVKSTEDVKEDRIKYERASNALYKKIMDENKWSILSKTDDFNEILYGVGVTKHFVKNGKWKVETIPIEHFLIDVNAKPYDLTGDDTKYCCHRNIIVQISDLVGDIKYDQKTLKELMIDLKKDADNYNSNEINNSISKNNAEVYPELSALNIDEPEFFEYGTPTIELREHHIKIFDTETNRDRRLVVVTTERDTRKTRNDGKGDVVGYILRKEWEDIIQGTEDIPFVAWSSEPESSNIYPQSVAGSVSPMNQLINLLVGSATTLDYIKSLNMGIVDQDALVIPAEGFELGAFAMFPVSGNPNEAYTPFNVQSSSEIYNTINAFQTYIDRSTNVSSILQGGSQKGEQTFSEVETLVNNSLEQITSRNVARVASDIERADKILRASKKIYDKLDPLVLDTRGYSDESISIEFSFKALFGGEEEYDFVCKSISQQEKSIRTQQKANGILTLLQLFPQNSQLQKMASTMLLRNSGFETDEIQRVLEEQEQDNAQQKEALKEKELLEIQNAELTNEQIDINNRTTQSGENGVQ